MPDMRPTQTDLRTATPLWRNRDFRLLFAAQVVSLLGSGVTTVGLALFAYELTGGASATVVIGYALTLRILAFLMFSQPAGVIADRVSRKRILIAADVARFGLLTLFPFVTAVWQVYALIFAINAVTAFFTPTFEASIPEVVGGEQYVKALSWSRVAVDIEAVAAPAVAGLLVTVLGVRWVFWFDACTYLFSGFLVWLAVIPRIERPTLPLSFKSLGVDLTTGSRLLFRQPALRQALILSAAEATAGAVAIVVTVDYVRSVLHRGETAFTVVMAALGSGSALAAIALGRLTGRYEEGALAGPALHARRHRWTNLALLGGGVLLGLHLLPGMLVPSLVVLAALWAMNGAGQALIAIASSTLLAEHTAERERGRAYAAHFALTHVCWLGTYPAVGYAAARWGSPVTFTAAGVTCLLITALAKVVGPGPQTLHEHSGEAVPSPA